jgi:ATP synthase protein I
MTEDKEQSAFARALTKAAPLLNLGLVLAVLVLVGSLGGWWLDRWLGTGPWLLVTGLFLGIALGFVQFFSAVLSQSRNGKGGSE